jgi:hypothetical protein
MAKPSTKHIPRGRDYTEPLRSKLPALEQNVLKLRAMNTILVMFYAEDLKRSVLGIKKTLSDPPTSRPLSTALSVLSCVQEMPDPGHEPSLGCP